MVACDSGDRSYIGGGLVCILRILFEYHHPKTIPHFNASTKYKHRDESLSYISWTRTMIDHQQSLQNCSPSCRGRLEHGTKM